MHTQRKFRAPMAACILLSVIALVSYDTFRRQSYVILYPEHMVEKSAQYGFGYGKPGIGYGPTVWEEERRQGEKNRFPWPQSSDRWWVDHNDGPGSSNDGRAYPIPFIPHLRDDMAGGDAFDSDMTPAFAAQDHTGGGAPYLAWGAYAYTPWVRSITPTEAPEGEWHQRRWAKVLRALWDKKYYVEPYYASEPLHSPVLHMLHLKDYIPDMGGRTGDGRGEPPESQRLMASGNEDARGRARVETDGQELPESQRYWQEQRTQGNTEVYFGYPEMRQVRSRLPDDMKLAASRHLQRKAQQVAGADGVRPLQQAPPTSLSLRSSLHPRSHVERSTIPDCLHAADASCLAATDALVHSSDVESSIIPDESSIIPDDPSRNMMREANGQPELQHLAATADAATSATASSHTSTTTDTTDTSRSSSFFSKWGHGAQREVWPSRQAPPSSPDAVAKWWADRRELPDAESRDVWSSPTQRRARAQLRVAAKAQLLDLCFGTLNHHPARNLVMYTTQQQVGGDKRVQREKADKRVQREKAVHEEKKEEACRILRSAA